MDPIGGGCLCGAVWFEICGKPLFMSYCHCSRCRKTAGAFAAIVMVRAGDFRLLSGEADIRQYAPEPPFAMFEASAGPAARPSANCWGRRRPSRWPPPPWTMIPAYARPSTSTPPPGRPGTRSSTE